jgi:excisionase family DNA binding protein
MLPAAEELLTVRETAVLLRISRKTAYRWIASGYLPAIQYGQPRAEGETRRGGAIRVLRSVAEDLRRNSEITAEEAA